MMTGEIDTSSLPFGSDISYKHMFFIIFIFFVVMVLNNLLSALAISDTRTIMEDAKVIALRSRVKLISAIETRPCKSYFVIFGGCLFPIVLFHLVCRSAFQRYLPKLEKYITNFIPEVKDETSFRKIIRKSTISIRPHQQNAIIIERMKDCIKMDPSIVKEAYEILNKRNQPDTTDDTNYHFPTSTMKLHPSKSEFVQVHISDETLYAQKRDSELKIDQKIAYLDDKLTKIGEQLLQKDERIEKLLEADDKLFAQKCDLELMIDQKIAHLDDKLTKIGEQLMQKDKQIEKLLEADEKSYAQKCNLELMIDQKIAHSDDKFTKCGEQLMQKVERFEKLLESVTEKLVLLEHKK